MLSGEKCHFIVLEDASEMKFENHSPQNKPSPKNYEGLPDSSAKGVPSPSRRPILASKESGSRETCKLDMLWLV